MFTRPVVKSLGVAAILGTKQRSSAAGYHLCGSTVVVGVLHRLLRKVHQVSVIASPSYKGRPGLSELVKEGVTCSLTVTLEYFSMVLIRMISSNGTCHELHIIPSRWTSHRPRFEKVFAVEKKQSRENGQLQPFQTRYFRRRK